MGRRRHWKKAGAVPGYLGPALGHSPAPGLARRQFLKLAGMAAAGATLSGCAAWPRLNPTRTPAPVELVYQDWNTEWFPPMAQRMIERFHATHPTIRVFFVPDPPSETFEEEMMVDFQAGTAPDVFQGCCSFFPIWAQKGFALDLRPYVEADLDQATLNDWDPVQYKALFTPDGLQYGLPKYHGALALYYNKDLLDVYSVDYPDDSWDHDDYLAAMKRLTRDLDGDDKVDQWGSVMDFSWDRIQVHVNAWGGHFVHPADPTRCLVAEPPALEALEWLRARIWDDRVMPTPFDVEYMSIPEAFVSGRVAMAEEGSWALKAILSSAAFRVGVAPFPAGPFRRATIATTDGFGISAHTRNPDEAWELMKFLISREYGRAMAGAHFLQPARASLVDAWVRFVRDAYPSKAQGLDVAAFADGHLRGYSVVAETFANQADAQPLLVEAWDKILSLGQAPVDLMKTVSEQVEALQRPAN